MYYSQGWTPEAPRHSPLDCTLSLYNKDKLSIAAKYLTNKERNRQAEINQAKKGKKNQDPDPAQLKKKSGSGSRSDSGSDLKSK